MQSDSSPLCLVTGAAGAVGPAVVQALLAAGWRVRTFSRTPPASGALPAGTEFCQGDVADAAAVAAAMPGVSGILHLAALLHVVEPPPALRAEYERVNLHGTRIVVESARRANAVRLVFLSTIAVYGPGRGRMITEDTPPEPDTFYGQTKLAAEHEVLTAQRADGKPLGVVLRPGAVYGPRLKGNYRRLVRSLARGRFIGVGSGNNRRTLIHSDDLARAAVLALQHPAAAGRVYNVTDGGAPTLAEIIAAICAALPCEPPRLHLPLTPTRWAIAAVAMAARWVGRQAPITPATLDKYVEDIVVDGSRLQHELGFRPQFDLNAGWQQTVLALRASGDLAP